MTCWVDGDERRTVVQCDSIGCSLDSSEQQKNNLLQPLYFSSSHLIYNSDSNDSFSASYKMIAFFCLRYIIKQVNINIYVTNYFIGQYKLNNSTFSIIRVRTLTVFWATRQ